MGVEIKIDADRPVTVIGDRDELLRVAENLIENAIKYGARQDGSGDDRVEIAVTRTASEGSLVVRDFGRGIAPEHLPRLTERFYRVDLDPEPGQERHRPRAGDRQAHPHPPPRPADDRQRARPGLDLHGDRSAPQRMTIAVSNQ